MFWKCGGVGSKIEEDRGKKKKMATDAKPNIFFPQAPPRNEGDAIGFKTSL